MSTEREPLTNAQFYRLFDKWFFGVGAATMLACTGTYIAIKRYAWIPNLSKRRFYLPNQPRYLEWYGKQAIAAGVFLILLGLTIHFAFYWSRHDRLYYFSELLTYLAFALAIVTGLYFMFFADLGTIWLHLNDSASLEKTIEHFLPLQFMSSTNAMLGI